MLWRHSGGLYRSTFRNDRRPNAFERVLRGSGWTLFVSPTGQVTVMREPQRTTELQEGTVYGVVTDSASGQPVANVLVRVKETQLRASTDERGQGDVQSVRIAPEVVDPDDVEMLEDLVLAAVGDGLRRAQDLAAEKMGGVTGDIDLGGLGNLLG